MRILGYCRVSTQEQASEGYSLDAQETRIRAWADAHDTEVVELVRDEGVSGTKLLADRPGGRKIAHLLESRRPRADAVVVVRMDRLGRDAAEQVALLKKFRVGKVGLVAIAQQIDLATPHGRAMAQIGAVFNELERALIAERTRDALTEKRRTGRAWNHPPFGWNVVDGFLVADLDEQETLRRIRQLRCPKGGQKEMSYAGIADILNEEGRRPKQAERWYAMSVRSVLLTSARVNGTEVATESDKGSISAARLADTSR